MNRIYLFGLLVLFTSLNSCDMLSDSNKGGIDNTFSFEFREYHEAENSDPILGIRISTNEQFPCVNYTLVTSHSIKNNIISISIIDVYISDICLTAIGPATTVIPLYLDEGNYGLELINGDIKDEFLISVKEEKIDVTKPQGFLERSYDFSAPFITWYRYPKNSFALVGGTFTDNTHLYENFLVQLTDSFEVKEINFPNNAYIPYPRVGSGHYVDFPASYFTYRTEEEYTRIGNFLIEYSSRNIKSGTGVGFSLRNWKNVSYLSWLHDRD